MVSTFCHYGVRNDETCECFDEDSCPDEITYADDDGKPVTIKNLQSCRITFDTVSVEDENFDTTDIPVDSIISWR